MAKKVRCINVFLQPGHMGHCKNVWDNCAIIWMGSTPKAFKAAILKEAVRQNANSGGKVEKKEIRACRAEKHKKRTCK